MADEKVSVLIKFDAKTRQLDAAIAKMALLNKYEKRFSSGQQLERFASRGSSAAEKLSSKWKKSFDLIDGAVKMTGKFLTGFLKTAIKGVIGQMGLFGAAMMGVHATFVVGQFAMKAYRGAMQVFAGGAAAATMAVAAFSAAMREQQAAMFAYRGKGASAFGSAMSQTRMGMRNLQADASLAVLGIEALNTAYGTMSKSMNVPQINASTSSIRALMDFGSAGQDPSKGLAQVAVVIASLSDKKKNISDVITEAKKLGPEMQEALKKANVKTKDEFSKLLMSGDLAKKGGVTGQFAAVNNTMIGQLKKYFTLLRVEFADFGDQFLEPLKVAFHKIFDVIKTDLARITAAISSTIGTQGVIDSMVGAIEKTSNFFVKMIRQYLPSAIGIFDRIGGWMENFKRGWNIVLDRLRPLIAGAKVLYTALSPIWDAIKEGVNQIFNFNDQLTGNGANFKEFGTNVASIITSISDALANMRSIFESISPFINDVLKGFGDVFKQVSSFLTGGSGKGFLMALAPLIAMQTLGSKMGSTSGRMSPVLGSFSKAVTIQAQTATIVAAGMSGRAGAFSGGGIGGRSSVMTPMGYVSKGDTIAAQQSFSSGGGSFGSMSAGAVAAAATGGVEAAANAANNYAKTFAIKDQKMQQEKNKAFSSGADDKQKAAAAAEAAKKTAVTGFRDLKNMPFTGLKGFLKASSDLTLSKFGAGIEGRKNAYRNQIQDQNALLNGPLAYLSPMRRMMEPITGGIGGTLAGGTPTNEQYTQATGGLGSKYETPEDRRARKEGLRTERDARRELLQERRKSRLKLAGATAEGGVRKAYGAVRGFGAYLKGPAFDPYGGEDKRGAYVDIGAARQEIFERRQNRMEQQNTLMGRTAARLGARRDMARLNRGEGTKFGRAMSKVGTSGGARFGVGAGLGLASQYAPEEMRGAMAMGAMAGQFDPRLGIAVAGVGGAMTARGAGKGALAGAAGGAAIGQFFSPVGALIGAGIGALAGALMGAANQAAHDMKIAGEIGKAAFMNLFAGLTQAAGNKFAENQKIIEEGGTFEMGTRGALQDLASQGASKMRAITDTLGLTGKSINQGAITTEMMRGVNLDAPTGSAAVDQQTNVQRMQRGVASSNLTGAGEARSGVYKVFKKQKELGLSMSSDELKKITKNEDTAGKYLDNLIGDAVEFEKYSAQLQTQVDARMNALSAATGKTAPELENMARAIGYDLYDATKSYEDVLKEFTAGLVKSSRELKDAHVDAFLALANPFKDAIAIAEGEVAINAATRGLSDKLRGGGLDEEGKNKEINTYMSGAFAQILAASGGDPLAAFEMVSNSFGQGPTGGMFAPGEQLAGLGGDFANNPLMADAMNKMRKDAISTYGGNVTTDLTSRGLQYGSGPMALMDKLGTITNPKVLSTALKSMSKFTALDSEGNVKSNADITSQINQIFADAGIVNTGLTVTKAAVAENKDLNLIANQVKDGYLENGKINKELARVLDVLNGKMTDNFFTSISNAPDWWQKGLVFDGKSLVPPPDTATPRGGAIGDTTTSRLSQTMDRHSSLNSQVPGNRSITSAWRNTNLGSSNSDHVTGRAYDLVGQNLGKYQTLAREGGGFAEFHGNFAKRHLHVVPGAGTTGDTSVPSSRGPATSSAGAATTVNNYYTFDINGSNMSPDAIAEVVMQKIDRKNKSLRERT